MLLAFSASCYSSEIRINDFNWTTSFPTGSNINNVIYSYTVEKEIADPFTVTVADDAFSSTDDWSGLPGSRINRFVPVAIPGENVKSGSITSTGTGTVSNPVVNYSYTYEEILTPPEAPAYTYDPMEDINRELEKDTFSYDNTEASSDSEEASTEELLGGKNDMSDPLYSAFASTIPNSYSYTYPGGVYEDTLTIPVNELPDNRAGRLTSYAQEIKHRTMVNSQYEK